MLYKETTGRARRFLWYRGHKCKRSYTLPVALWNALRATWLDKALIAPYRCWWSGGDKFSTAVRSDQRHWHIGHWKKGTVEHTLRGRIECLSVS